MALHLLGPRTSSDPWRVSQPAEGVVVAAEVVVAAGVADAGVSVAGLAVSVGADGGDSPDVLVGATVEVDDDLESVL